MSIRVLLSDDQPLLRRGFRMIIEADDDLHLVEHDRESLRGADVGAPAIFLDQLAELEDLAHPLAYPMLVLRFPRSLPPRTVAGTGESALRILRQPTRT